MHNYRTKPSFQEVMELIIERGFLKRKPRENSKTSINCQCPFCGDSGYHLNVNLQKAGFHCVRCDAGGGVLELYARLRGLPFTKGSHQDAANAAKALNEEFFGEGTAIAVMQPVKRKPAEEYHEIPCADANALHCAFSWLLAFPAFALSREHIENLRKRGLKDEDIVRNQYRSIPEDLSWIKQSKFYNAACRYVSARASLCKEYRQKEEEAIAGIIIATFVIQNGASLEGVPGFYKFGERWAFQLRGEGMLIPARDPYGRIVGMQARTNNPALRYITLSSKGLPCGPTENICRVHFPLLNKRITPATTVLLTEGPLKADVYMSLTSTPGSNIAIMAVQGVNNYKGLDCAMDFLQSCGCRKLYLCYDMDRITNPNVAQACKKAEGKAHKRDIALTPLYWDAEGAKIKLRQMYGITVENGIRVSLAPNAAAFCQGKAADLNETTLFRSIETLAHILYEKKVPSFNKTVWEWFPNTKGIDDFFLLQTKR